MSADLQRLIYAASNSNCWIVTTHAEKGGEHDAKRHIGIWHADRKHSAGASRSTSR